ncbi:uncharacterized protein PB18E9.04c-like, partial [Esox lucius]|uniref:uncharacterized protein PB18E9.04c-like n=1 Tax=Esox lucius TaxID=8010 RepID=UPI001476BE58
MTMTLGLLLILLFLLTGVSGDTCSLYTRVGDTVSLSCTNVVYPNCSSTTWTYHRTGLRSAIEEVGHGKINTNSKRADRLKVGSDCSLHVRDVRGHTASTAGTTMPVTSTSSIGHTASTAGTTMPVTSTSSIGHTASTAGTTMPVTSTSSIGHTASTAGTTMPVTSTSSIGSTASTSAPVSSATAPSSTDTSYQTTVSSVRTTTQQQLKTGSPPTQNIPVVVGVSVGVFVAVSISVIVAVIILHRRTKIQMTNDVSLGLNAINHSTPPDNEDRSQPAGSITYASINHVDQNPHQRVVAHGENAVTYASVMTSTDRGRNTKNPADPTPFILLSMHLRGVKPYKSSQCISTLMPSVHRLQMGLLTTVSFSAPKVDGDWINAAIMSRPR